MQNWNHTLSRDDEAGRSFAHHLGYTILNCGVIETLTYSYAAILSGAHFFGTDLSGKLFAARKKVVIERLKETNLSDKVRDKAIKLWQETTEIMNRRNLVAHNPINRVQVNRENGNEEQLLAVVDMAHSTPTNITLLDANKLANLANLADDLAHRLSDCLVEIRAELSAGVQA